MLERWPGILLALTLAGCGSDALVQGGGATETGNGFLVRVLDASGAPQASAAVTMVRRDTWLRRLAAAGRADTFTVVTDTSGLVRVDPLPGRWAAELSTGAGYGWVALNDSVQTLRLQTSGSVTETVLGEDASAVCALGTSWCGVPDAAGRVSLRLPPGSWQLVARHDTTALPLSRPVIGASDAVVASDTLSTGLLLDDFTSGDSHSRLFRCLGYGGWYVTSWGADSIRITYDSLLSLNYVGTDSTKEVLVGLALLDSAGFHDANLSTLDSVCFEARADGRAAMSLVHYDSAGSWQAAVTSNLTLGLGWQHICLRPSSWSGWSALVRSVNDVVWVTRAGSWLQLRGLTFWGVGLEDF